FLGSRRRIMAAAIPASHARPVDLSIPRYFRKLKDPRRAHRRLPLLQDILVIPPCALFPRAPELQRIETLWRERPRRVQRVFPDSPTASGRMTPSSACSTA